MLHRHLDQYVCACIPGARESRKLLITESLEDQVQFNCCILWERTVLSVWFCGCANILVLKLLLFCFPLKWNWNHAMLVLFFLKLPYFISWVLRFYCFWQTRQTRLFWYESDTYWNTMIFLHLLKWTHLSMIL